MISLVPLSKEHCAELSRIMPEDTLLREALGSESADNAKAFWNSCNKWMSNHEGQTYTVLLEELPIGTISLSRKELPEYTFRVGYWLSSAQWNRGYGTSAFAQILDIAR